MLPSRRTLLRRSLLAAPVLSADLFAPLRAAAQISPSSEQWYWYPFHNLTMKGTSCDTGNTTAWMLVENSPHQGVPLHKHLYEDESFFVISGIFEIIVGGKTTTGGPREHMPMAHATFRTNGRTWVRVAGSCSTSIRPEA
jgi:hypothetical protein